MGGGALDILGKGRGAFGTFMIMRTILLWSDWWKFSIWNEVMGGSTNQNEAFVRGFCAGFCAKV